jgi:hypothetical protein
MPTQQPATDVSRDDVDALYTENDLWAAAFGTNM